MDSATMTYSTTKAEPQRSAVPWLLGITVLAIIADRLTKLWVNAHVPMGGGITVIDRVFRITHVLNTGAAFSLFGDTVTPYTRYGLIAFSVFAVVVVGTMLFKLGRTFSTTTVGLALVLGGAIGNLYDRIWLHYVIDFLEVHIISYHWPDFNVADSCICIGACLLLIDVLRPHREGSAS